MTDDEPPVRSAADGWAAALGAIPMLGVVVVQGGWAAGAAVALSGGLMFGALCIWRRWFSANAWAVYTLFVVTILVSVVAAFAVRS